MHLKRISMMVLMCALATVSAFGQTTTGSILGDVTDASGARLPGTAIRATNQQTGATRETLTDELGAYRFSALQPADYTITAEINGFRSVARQNVKLPIASQVKIDFRLEVATVAETITVTEEAPLVETTENAVKTFIDLRRIEELPLKTRDFLDLAMLAPGVVTDQGSAAGGVTDSISFGGMGEGYKSVWLEGVDFNDEVTGGGTGISSATRTALAQEAIQEFQVMANSYSAEFGRSASGAINVVTKSGGNAFHGNAYYFRRDDAFDKPNFFSRTVPPFKTDQFGATIGGPIQKDRLFFFLSYERRVNDRSATVNIPATLRDFVGSLGYDVRPDVPTPSRFSNYFGKLSYTLNPRHSFAMTYFYDRRSAKNIEAGGVRSADSGFNDERHSYFAVANLTSLLGQSLVNELRVNLSRQYLFREGVGSGGDPGRRGKPELVFPGITFGRDNSQGRGQKNYIVSDSASYRLVGAGQHELKFGGEMNIVPTTSELNETFHGRFEFLRDQPVIAGNAATLPYRYTEGVMIRPNPFSNRIMAGLSRDVSIYAWFLNDSWRLRPNLTLNLGLRYDLQLWRGDLNGEAFPTDAAQQTSSWIRLTTGDLRGKNFKPVPVDKNNFSPRIGLSWDPRNNGKTVVRAGWGFFYDQISTNGLRTIVAGYPGFITSSVANDSRLTNIPNSFFPNKPRTGTLSEAGGTQFRIPNGASEFPYTQQYTAGMSRQMGADYAVSVDYVYMHGLHFPRNINVNARQASGTFPLIAAGTRLTLEDTGNVMKIHQMQARIEKRFANRLGFLFGYTLGSARSFADTPVDNRNANADWGPTSNDVRHRIVSNAMYQLPYGINLGTVLTFNTAAPYNVTTGQDTNRDGANNERPAGVAFNSARGDKFFTLDLRTSKKVNLGERMGVEVLWEMFNVFNNVNLTSYVGNQLSSQFRQARTAFDPFQAQLGFKFTF